MDILDDEASDDESARRSGTISRAPSYIAGKELVDKGVRYQKIIADATASDALIQNKWDQYNQYIEHFMLSPVCRDKYTPTQS